MYSDDSFMRANQAGLSLNDSLVPCFVQSIVCKSVETCTIIGDWTKYAGLDLKIDGKRQ